MVQVHRGDFGMSDDDLRFYNIPNPYELDIFQDDVTDVDAYFEGSWYQSNNNLHSGPISAITNTNYETDIEIEHIKIIYCSHDMVYDENPINAGEDLNIDASEFINASIIQTESDFGDNVEITPKMFYSNIEITDSDSVLLIYELKVKSTIYDLDYTLLFQHWIQPSDNLQGDLNGDNNVNILDVVQLVQMIVNADEYEPIADMNGDGLNNVLDVVIMVNSILGN